MRFHVGISKRISIKKLIQFIAFLFVACLTFLGIYDKAHAWTSIPYNNFIGKETESVDLQGNPITSSCTGLISGSPNSNQGNFCLWRSHYANGKYRLGVGSNNSSFVPHKKGMFYVAQSQGAIDSNLSDVISDTSLKVKFSNSNYCPNNESDDLKSTNFKFYVELNPYNNDFSVFNLSSDINDNIGVSMSAYDTSDSNNIRVYTNSCTIGDYLGYSYPVYCNNIFTGSVDYSISYFTINFINKSPFNNRYLSSTDNYSVVYNPILTYNTNGTSSGYDFTLQYECSEEPPVFEPVCNPGECDDDPAGLNDIYNVIKNDYSTEIPGIDTSLTLLKLPTTFTDILMLPFDVVQTVINNSDSCSTYDIDFSSIIHKWGDPRDDYILHLPCMRSVLSSKLGNWYIIADMLICFFVFYNISMHVINLISAITSGEDLFSYFFKPSNSVNNGRIKYVDSNTGEVIN